MMRFKTMCFIVLLLLYSLDVAAAIRGTMQCYNEQFGVKPIKIPCPAGKCFLAKNCQNGDDLYDARGCTLNQDDLCTAKGYSGHNCKSCHTCDGNLCNENIASPEKSQEEESTKESERDQPENKKSESPEIVKPKQLRSADDNNPENGGNNGTPENEDPGTSTTDAVSTTTSMAISTETPGDVKEDSGTGSENGAEKDGPLFALTTCLMIAVAAVFKQNF